MRKVIFVCTGGTCRSPMAEHIFKKKLKDKGISLKEIQVASAGIMSNLQNIHPHTVMALKKLGINVPYSTKSRQLNKKMITKDTIIITMTNEHKEWLKNLPNVYSLNDFEKDVYIFDIYGMPVSVYEKLANVLNYILDEVVDAVINNKI